MDIFEFEGVYKWFILRACFVALLSLVATVVCLKVYEHIGCLKAAVKRYGWPLVTLFIAYSAWATYTAFPTQEEKEAYRRYQNGQAVTNSVWAGIYAPGNLPASNNTTHSTESNGANDSHQNDTNGTETNVSADSETADNEETGSGNNSGDGQSLTSVDFARGFVLTRIGTNEVYDFTAPTNAVFCDDWLAFGAAEDWVYLRGMGNGEWGTDLRVHSDGWVSVLASTSRVFAAKDYYPFKTRLGIVPEANWERIVGYVEEDKNNLTQSPQSSQSEGGRSCFWSFLTPSNSLQLTWQNALYNREANIPISFQIEFFDNGDFTYRYDITSIKSKIDSGNTPENFPSNITIGTHSPFPVPSSLFPLPSSLFFRRLNSSDTPGSDRDGDGLTIEDELFVHYTDPYNRDTDWDGLSDYEELFTYDTNPLNAYSQNDAYSDGLAVKLCGVDPLSYPQGSTNTVLEHIFYSGSTNGVFSYPQSTDAFAVLQITVSGTGKGNLIVGDKVVPLISPSQLNQEVTKGETVRLKLLSDTTLNVGFESKDFAFGVLPSKNRDGWINFPNTKATEPCIHDFTARKVAVNLPVKKDASELSCIWSESENVEVENIPPRSAEITGRFNPKENRTLTYSLSHPKYLFGKMMFEQFVRFCPVPTDTEKWDDPSSGPYTYDQNDVCLCCDSEFCHEDCDCICAGTCKDDYLEEDNNVVKLDHICPIHMLLFEDCANLHENEYTNALHKQHLSGVLYIREPIEFEQIPLEVPTTYSNCCSCVDHWTNYVALAYKSKRLLLLDSQNEPFRITETSCVVRLAGVTPSYSINDSQLMFSRNGQIYHEQERTVLGVDIKTKTDNRKKYNLLNPNFGVPVTICTNIENAAELNLVTNVKLPTGNIHLELIGTTGQFTVWYYDYEIGSYRKLLDSDTVSTKTVSIRNWRKIMKSSREGDFTDLPIYVTSSVPGNTKLVFRYWAVIEDKFVEDTVEQKITSILPPIRMDINHDNIINEDDVGLYLDGGLFRFWCNSETVKGDFVGQFENTTLNADDLVVNGTYDLVNFFPMEVDFSSIRAVWGDNVTYRIKMKNSKDGDFNFCIANVPQNNIRSMQINSITTTEGKDLSAADLIRLPLDGYTFSSSQLDALSSGNSLLIVEAKEINNLIVSIEYGEEELYSYEAPLSLSSIQDMYRWLNERPAVGDYNGEYSQLWNPWNRPDEECDGRHFVFVHGYNVNSEDARMWANQIFKRLWWSGSKSMFTAIDWRGDSSQFSTMFSDKKVSPDYYVNVKNAFLTAPTFAQDCNNLPGEKVVLAHSLGNIIVSAAAKDNGLFYSKYYMLNAAVPMEAYDIDADEQAMIDTEWMNVPLHYRASDWSNLFPQNDFRSSLSWRGRFAGIANTINCYSPTEDVLANPAEGQLTFIGGAWKIQELSKGTTVWHEINSLPFLNLDVACEGGWGINTFYSLNPLWYIYQYGFTEKVKDDLSREEAIIHPLFTPFRSESESMHSTNLFMIVNASYRNELRAKFLADAIPATSFAAGANHTGGLKDNHNMQSQTPNGWPEQRSEDDDFVGVVHKWYHSDIKNISFYYIHKVFEKITKEN